MIPISHLTNLFQKDEKELLKLLQLNKVKSLKIGDIWMIDENSLLHIILPNQRLPEYKAEETDILEEEKQLLDRTHHAKKAEKIIPLAIRETLLMSTKDALGLNTRLTNSLLSRGVETVEDLLRCIKYGGFEQLRTPGRIGKNTLKFLRFKLRGIIDANGDSEYFEYI